MSLFGRPTAEQLLGPTTLPATTPPEARKHPPYPDPTLSVEPQSRRHTRTDDDERLPGSAIQPLTGSEREVVAEIRDSPELSMQHLMALRSILSSRGVAEDGGRPLDQNRPGESEISSSQFEGIYAALEAARKKQQEAESRASALEVEKREIARAKEQLVLQNEAEARELRDRRMMQVVGRIMGKSVHWAFERWCDAMEAGVRGEGHEEQLQVAKLRIAELEVVVQQIKQSPARSPGPPTHVSASAEMFVMYEEKLRTANGRIKELEGEMLNRSSTDSSTNVLQLEGIYAALEAARKKQQEAESRASALEVEKREIARAKEQLVLQNEAEARELRDRRMMQVVGRIMGKSVHWAFERWCDAMGLDDLPVIAVAMDGRERLLESEPPGAVCEALAKTRDLQEKELLRISDLEAEQIGLRRLRFVIGVRFHPKSCYSSPF